AAGVVEEIGEGVSRPRVGDAVVLTWRAPCGACDPCRAGRPVFCARPAVAAPRMKLPDGAALGRVLGLGAFATHVAVPPPPPIPVPRRLRPEAAGVLGLAP